MFIRKKNFLEAIEKSRDEGYTEGYNYGFKSGAECGYDLSQKQVPNVRTNQTAWHHGPFRYVNAWVTDEGEPPTHLWLFGVGPVFVQWQPKLDVGLIESV